MKGQGHSVWSGLSTERGKLIKAIHGSTTAASQFLCFANLRDLFPLTPALSLGEREKLTAAPLQAWHHAHRPELEMAYRLPRERAGVRGMTRDAAHGTKTKMHPPTATEGL